MIQRPPFSRLPLMGWALVVLMVFTGWSWRRSMDYTEMISLSLPKAAGFTTGHLNSTFYLNCYDLSFSALTGPRKWRAWSILNKDEPRQVFSPATIIRFGNPPATGYFVRIPHWMAIIFLLVCLLVVLAHRVFRLRRYARKMTQLP